MAVFQAEFNVVTSEASLSLPIEEIDERSEGLTDGTFTATLFFKCLWEDRLILARELMGNTSVTPEIVTVILPSRYPDNPYRNALVNNVDIDPLGKSIDGTPPFCNFIHAILTTSYSIPDGDKTPSADVGKDSSLVLTTESLEPRVEFITIPNKKLFFDANQLERVGKDLSPVTQVHMLDWVITQHKQPAIPLGALGTIGFSNEVKLTSKTLSIGGKQISFEPQTLLFNAPTMERDTTTEGQQAWRITYRLTRRVLGWNKFFKDGINVSEIFDEQGNQVFPYPPADFSPVIPAIFD